MIKTRVSIIIASHLSDVQEEVNRESIFSPERIRMKTNFVKMLVDLYPDTSVEITHNQVNIHWIVCNLQYGEEKNKLRNNRLRQTQNLDTIIQSAQAGNLLEVHFGEIMGGENMDIVDEYVIDFTTADNDYVFGYVPDQIVGYTVEKALEDRRHDFNLIIQLIETVALNFKNIDIKPQW